MHRFSWRSDEGAGLTRRVTRKRVPPETAANVLSAARSVSRFIDMMTFADGACVTRSRSKEKAIQEHRRRRATQRSPA
ncbi:hypothetical protein KAJ77_04640, partial [bacterium]|nr:hypothetical protein [bacterium]